MTRGFGGAGSLGNRVTGTRQEYSGVKREWEFRKIQASVS